MELIGLVVIVILITLGLLFAAQFALKNQPQKKIFTRQGLASSTMSTLMKVTIPDCQRMNLQKDFLEDCAVSKYFNSQPQKFCDEKNSCDFLNATVTDLLQESLGGWQKRYQFSSRMVSTNEEVLFIRSEKGDCQKRERDTSGEFYLNTKAGLVESVLYICD